jgi:hypothetical protein
MSILLSFVRLKRVPADVAITAGLMAGSLIALRAAHSDDCPPIRPPHGWNAPDADLVPVFHEGVDRWRKPALVPGGLHVWRKDAQAFSDWDDDLAFRNIGVFGEKRARNVVAKSPGFAVALLDAYELSSLKRKTWVHVMLRRVDWKSDILS